MSKFNIEDKVKVVNEDDCFYGEIGKVIKLDPLYTMREYEVQFGNETEYYDDYELELIEEYNGCQRGFEIVSSFTDKNITIPQRKTKYSAGYDISIITPETIILPQETKVFSTGLKAYMLQDEVLEIHVRSSLGIKRGLVLSNITGIIDADYYNNPDNEGHIMVALTNISNRNQKVSENERVAQGIFKKYLIADNDSVSAERKGGIGSTNEGGE